MKRIIVGYLIFFLFQCNIIAQTTRVLFIGNSYTQVNNLPNLFSTIASSTGDDVFVDSNTPGGCTFQLHCSNQSATMIQQGGWDFIVLQEQSQLPAFPLSQVQSSCFPYATQLNQMIETFNPCAETVFYMTWGRKYGDQDNAQFFPPIGTYEGMDSLLFERYMQMTQDNNAIVSPVGRVWRYLRTNSPNIELYSSDNSHPSLAGSYAAACAMYVAILRKDPTSITNYCGLDQNTAQIIQNAAKIVVFNNQSTWFIGERALNADFLYTNLNGFQNTSLNTNSTTHYIWSFGNGDSSLEENPAYVYDINGNYTVTLQAIDDCGQESTITKNIEVLLNKIDQFDATKIKLFPNPATNYVHLDLSKMKDQQVIISILDIFGKTVRTLYCEEKSPIIDLSFLNSGLYFLKVEQRNLNIILKLIVQ